MSVNEKLFQEIEAESKKLDEIKEKIAKSIYFLFKRYVYSIDKKIRFRGVTLKVGNYKAKLRRESDGGDWLYFKVYVDGRKCISMSHYDCGYAPKIDYVNIDKLLELQDFHNKIIEITTEKLLIKKEKFDRLSNFTLALKELEV